MKQCNRCQRQSSCRVPRDMGRFETVAHRLEQDASQPLLRERLHFFLSHSDCLVDAGFVTL